MSNRLQPAFLTDYRSTAPSLEPVYRNAAVIAVDNGNEFAGKAMDAWSHQHGGHVEFIRPGKAVDNGYIEPFNSASR